MEYLTHWCTKYLNKLKHDRYVILKDNEGHYSFLWYSKDTENVVHQMERDMSPVVYPVPKYELIEVLKKNDIKLYKYNF